MNAAWSLLAVAPFQAKGLLVCLQRSTKKRVACRCRWHGQYSLGEHETGWLLRRVELKAPEVESQIREKLFVDVL